MEKQATGLKRLFAIGLVLALLCGMLPAGVFAAAPKAAGESALLPYQNPALSFEERAADLVSRMTPAEKYSQLTARTASALPRLGIKAYDWWSEGLHGVARDGEATSFPTGLGIAATWDVDLVHQMMSATSDEARDKYNSGRNNHGLNYWSPTINMDRDPRWGRVEETYGEDPYLTGRIAEAFITGLQGDDEDGYYKTVSTAKHFLANNSEQNRHNGSSNVDERDLREYYTKAFKYAVEEAGVGSIMTSYNAVNGVPMSVNEPIVDDMLRRTWGFDGFVVTDCGALNDIVNNHKWRPEGWTGTWNGASTAAYAINAGTDLNCGSVLGSNTGAAVNSGLLSENAVDRALVRLFTARMRTGEFDPDGGPYAGIRGTIQSADNQKLAEDGADNAVVLLQNKDSFLPLRNINSLVLVGDLADEVILGDYSTDKPQNTSNAVQGISAALKRANPNAAFTYIPGSASTTTKTYMMNTRNLKLMDANGNVKQTVAMRDSVQQSGCQIESAGNIGYSSSGCWIKFNAGHMNFDGVSRFSVEMSGDSSNTNVTVLELRAMDPVTGPLLGTVTADILNGWSDYRTYTFDATVGGGYTDQDIYLILKTRPMSNSFTAEEAAKIQAADAVVFFGGTRPGENGFAEERDGANVDLPNHQNDLIAQVASLNKNTVVYIQAVTQANVEPFRADVKAILWSTYNGQAQGNAAGRLLFGESVPSAKLPFTWYTNVAQLNTITDYTMRADAKGAGRTYRYFTGNVTYSFGYGLSYTTFAYSNLTIDKTAVTPNDTIRVEFDVTNTGSVDAQEVAQLYVASPDAAAKARPVKQLEGFDKKAIAAGETVHFALELDVSDLWFWDAENDKEVFDQGVYTIQVGADSAAAENMTAQFTLSGELVDELHVVRAIPNGQILDYAKEDQVITTELTASCADQTFLDLDSENVTVTYTSSNPNVAKVDADGNVSAVGGGLATITASVSYNGKTLSDSFAVAVKQSVLAKSIMVDGVKLSDFAPETYAYAYGVESLDSFPVVSVETDPNFKVEIQQASAENSTAVITLTSGEITTTYTIRFILPPKSFDFTKTSLEELRSGWEIINPDEGLWTLDEKGLTLITAEGDIYQNNNTYSNLFLQDGYGDWTLEAKINFPETPTKNYQQAAILAYQDDDNYVKVDYEYCNAPVIQIGSEQNASWSSAGTKSFNGHDLYYRLVKEGNTYTAYYCTDGKSFVQYGNPVVMSLENIKIGLLAINGDGSTAPSIPATFAYLRIIQADDCTCKLSELVVEKETTLPEPEAGKTGTHTMTASVTASGDCKLEGHASEPPVFTYALTPDGINTCGASVNGNVLTYTGGGKVQVRVTASWNTATPIYKDVTYIVPAGDEPAKPGYYYDFTGMTKDELLEDWSIIREAGDEWKLGANGLTITTKSGDLYQGNNDCHNLFVRDAAENWTLEARIHFPTLPSQNYQQASILAYQDDNNYVKLSYEYGGKTYIQIGQEKNGTWSQSGQQNFSGNDLFYRLIKNGESYTAYYSTDGVSFTQLGKTVTQSLASPKLGLCAINGYNSSANSIPVEFVYLHYVPDTHCSCTMSDLVTEGETVLGSIADGEAYTYTIPAPAVTLSEGCPVEGHAEAAPEFTYALKQGGINTCGASLDGNVLTATQPGKVEVEITAAWNEAAPLVGCATYTIPRAMRVIEANDFTKMSKEELLSGWYILRENAANWAIGEQGLTITSEEGDLYQGNNTCHNLFLHNMEGDWTLEAEVDFASVPVTNWQQSSILSYQDDDNYVKLSYEFGGSRTYLQLGVEVNGKFTAAKSVSFAGTNVKYRLEKVGSTYTALYSTDGIRYTSLGSATADFADVKLGLTAINGYDSKADALDVTFRQINILGCDHVYETVATEPTCVTPGLITKTCRICGDITTEEIPALGHAFSEAWSRNDTAHWHECEKDGCALTVDEYQQLEGAAYGAHDYVNYICICGQIDLAGAAEEAKAALTGAAGTNPSEAVKAVAETYAAKLDQAETLAEIAEIKAEALEKIAQQQKEEADNCPSRRFTDMPAHGNWVHEGIDYCVAAGLMNGMSETTFEPYGSLTRAQLVTILYRIAGTPEVTFTRLFSDVKADDWFADAVIWAAGNGIVNGTGRGRFEPNGTITREQIATMLYRCSGSPAVEGDLSAYPDGENTTDYARNAMVWATKAGLINGIKSGDETTLQPQSGATRAQIAAIIMRFRRTEKA